MMNEQDLTLLGTKIVCYDESESVDLSRQEEAVDDELRMKVQISQEEEQEAEEISETKPQENQNPGETEESHNTIDEQGDVAITESDAINPQQQKALKKPDEILPCPRCNSMDTKFCYFNNYNVNQPRHFCRDCKRYWTAGGMLRNVPVGAGCRKNKKNHQLTISQALHKANINARNGFQHGAFQTNGTVLSFGPSSESMASVLNPSRQKISNWVRSGCFYRRKLEIKDDISLGSSATTSNSVENGEKYGLQHPTSQNMNVVPRPYLWNPTVPLPFFPPVCGMPNAWTNSPWISSTSTPNSPLGKHSRSGELIKPKKNSESSIVVPKALRIDDPEEAAKSSIWSTLGIKYDSRSRGGLFKSLQPKVDEKNAMVTAPASPALTANPAALSRSVSFRERT